jgi:hypothetical protein
MMGKPENLLTDSGAKQLNNICTGRRKVTDFYIVTWTVKHKAIPITGRGSL